jgi:hypothetical protein
MRLLMLPLPKGNDFSYKIRHFKERETTLDRFDDKHTPHDKKHGLANHVMFKT